MRTQVRMRMRMRMQMACLAPCWLGEVLEEATIAIAQEPLSWCEVAQLH